MEFLEIISESEFLRWVAGMALVLGAVYVPALLLFVKFRQERWLAFLLRAIWLGFALLLFLLSVAFILLSVPMTFFGLIGLVLEPLEIWPVLLFAASGGALLALWKGLFILFRYQETLAQEGAA